MELQIRYDVKTKDSVLDVTATLDLAQKTLKISITDGRRYRHRYELVESIRGYPYNSEFWVKSPPKKVASTVNGSVVLWLPSITELAELLYGSDSKCDNKTTKQ